ncbi:probable NADH dehydrogenase [ubiquinone] 1 alpha subcomplex subunit 5, mitochondrial isoform X1 [Zingiber officinale]|uniref:probable NADH dehydrogenase [ubiquinone] 1 alpha subcomplex subunit 5, mitochondrial isoform X1 n=1 Tax=Zingiber officinale TaxID=94328 RepID=UPI001C4D49F5|nr:probable NADH dehydrogenase [ubiquinone] 1 alpha subcomplex subunit 5, mitochondrial isoform X1 [Zingiber officinale]
MRSSTVIEFDFEAKMFLRRVLLGGGWRAMSTQVGKKVKETTGIVGLDVVPNAREVLISLYTRTLREIQVVPPDEGYRKAVESFTRQRLNVCLEEDDWEEIENRLGCGQVEELIEEAKDELTLISKMIEYSVTILILGVCLRALRHYVTAEGRTFKRLIERIIPCFLLLHPFVETWMSYIYC